MSDTTAPLSRRSFLKASAVALGGGLFASRSPAADDAGDLGAGISLGVQSYTFRNFDLEPALKRMKDVGIHYCEFFNKHISPDSSPEKITGFLGLCKEYGVKPVGFGVSSFTNNHAANKKLF